MYITRHLLAQTMQLNMTIMCREKEFLSVKNLCALLHCQIVSQALCLGGESVENDATMRLILTFASTFKTCS